MKVALIGNQNSGKTTLFNALTGSNQKIGNWPGVTIEHKSGMIKGTQIELIDLPGIYSLSPYTIEESISRQFLIEEKPDLLINLVDATSIERSLYLTTQLMELEIDMILVLNMQDRFESKGLKLDTLGLQERLKMSVVSISALKNTNLQELICMIQNKTYQKHQTIEIFDDKTESLIKAVSNELETKHQRFLSIKLLEKDPLIVDYHSEILSSSINELEKEMDTEELFASKRYDYIESLKKDTVIQNKTEIEFTDKLDKLLLNRYLALPIFVVVMFLIYYLSVGVVGSFTVDLIDGLIGSFSDWTNGFLETVNASSWSRSLVVDGMIAGVGAVLNFVPQLIILFLMISLLETSGYMTRIAFFLDRLFKKFGLSGKALIPFIVGSGCSVPGIMATRTIESQDERRISIMVTPFIPCSAKLPIIAMFAGYFFKDYAGFISFSLYFLSIIIIVVSSIIMKKFFFKGVPSSFISELPSYQIPNVKYVLKDVYYNVSEFITRAGTIILFSSIIIWFMASFSFTLQYGVDINQSILAGIGNVFSFLFYPILGELSWAASVSAIQGLVAKEQVVSSMAVIAGLSPDVSDGNLIFGSTVFQFFTPASSYAFMVFNLFSAPCFGAIGAMHRELGSAKKTWFAVLFQTGLAYILASLTFIILSVLGGIL